MTHSSRTKQHSNQSSRPRSGHALVECIVAGMLLAITGLALGATTRGTLALADDSELVTKAQSLTTTRVEDALSGNCVASANGFDTRPRMNVLWVQTAGSRQTQTHLDVTLSRSPIAAIGHTTVQMAIESGGVCP